MAELCEDVSGTMKKTEYLYIISYKVGSIQ